MQEVCQHVHGKAALTGTVSNSGGNYKITVIAINCRTGEIAGTSNGETRDPEAVAHVASNVAGKLIRKLLISP